MNRKKITRTLVNTLLIGVLAFGTFLGTYSKANAETTTSAGTQVTGSSTGVTDAEILDAVNHLNDSSGKSTAEIQAKNYLTPATATSTAAAANKTNYQQVTSNVLGCSVGQLLSSLIVSGITTSLNSMSSLLGVFTGYPVNDSQLNRTQAFQTATSHGFQIFGVYVGVSLDSIAYCIVNTILEYVANSVINWANSGFNGNPSFVENPDRFFQSLADQQASSFISSLAYNTTKAVNNTANQVGSAVSGSVLGAMNVCQPFRTNVALSLANSYGMYGNNTAGNAGYASYGSCGLTTAAQNDFLAGNSRKDYFTNMHYVSQYGANNYIDQQLAADAYLNKLNAQTINTASKDLDRGQSFQSYKVCSNPNDPNSCNITTPGSTINKSLQNTINLGQERLVLANKFDQVVTAIVNNLIKVALNKALTPVGAAISSGTTQLQSAYSSR